MAAITVSGQVTDGGVGAGILSVALINIDERTTGATGRATGDTDGSGNYSITLDGAEEDQFAVVAKSTDATKFAAKKWFLSSETSYTKDLALSARKTYMLKTPHAVKLKITNL